MKERFKSLIIRTLTSSKANGEEGVTLIELLAVVVILGVIAVIAVPVVGNAVKDSKVNTTKQNMAILAQALARYAADNDGQYPTASAATDLNSDSTLKGDLNQYLQGVPVDGWSNDFYYLSDGKSFTLETAQAASNGKNGDEAWYIYNDQSTPTSTPKTN